MVSSKATSVAQYLKELPADRRAVVSATRDLVKKNLPKGFEEGMQYGMIAWYVPLSVFPDTYNGQPLAVCALASQKQSVSLYMMGIYSSKPLSKWFATEWKKTKKKLDMGKACLRFRSFDDLASDVVAQAIRRVDVEELITQHDDAHPRKKTAPKKKVASRRSRA